MAGNQESLTLNFDQDPEEGSLPVLLSSLKTMPSLTSLSLRYEATQATLCHVNGILAKLADGDFPKLLRLKLFPYGEANLCLNPYENQKDNKVSIAAASSLQVLQVRLGHVSTLGLDWKFARNLPNLLELHIFKLGHLTKDFGRQIQHFLDSFQENVFNDRLKMDIDFRWHEPEEPENRSSAPSASAAALQSLFDFVKPSEVSLILKSSYVQNPDRTKIRLVGICRLIPLAVLHRLSIHLQLSEQDLQNNETVGDCNVQVATAMQSASFSNPNMAVHLSIDIDFGDGRKTFVEAEKHPKGLHLSLRYGPKFDMEELLHDWGGRVLAGINKRPKKETHVDFRRRLESRPDDVGGGIKCSEVDMEPKHDANDAFRNPQKLPWKRVQFSEPEASLRAFLMEKVRYSKILKKNVPVCTCELYSSVN